jgi:hypothetical protein
VSVKTPGFLVCPRARGVIAFEVVVLKRQISLSACAWSDFVNNCLQNKTILPGLKIRARQSLFGFG